MACCGSRRTSLAAYHHGHRATPPPEPAPPADAVPLRYTGGADLALRGPASGRVYRVGPRRRDALAEGADVPALVATGLFAQA